MSRTFSMHSELSAEVIIPEDLNPAFTTSTVCMPIDVAVFSANPRIHVRCDDSITEGQNSVSFFAVSTSDANANRFLDLLQRALLTHRRLIVHYETDTTFNPAECLSNCRRLQGLQVQVTP